MKLGLESLKTEIINPPTIVSINDSALSIYLYNALENDLLIVIGANGLLKDSKNNKRVFNKIEIIKEEIKRIKDSQIVEHYYDDGVNFTKTLSVIAKTGK